jgi:hypothetical protein
MAVRGMDDVDVSPYEWTRWRGERKLGLSASRVFMRGSTVWASYGWDRGEDKDGPESKSKGDSAHPGWESSRSPEDFRRRWRGGTLGLCTLNIYISR